jgi:hypothetical protein
MNADEPEGRGTARHATDRCGQAHRQGRDCAVHNASPPWPRPQRIGQCAESLSPYPARARVHTQTARRPSGEMRNPPRGPNTAPGGGSGDGDPVPRVSHREPAPARQIIRSARVTHHVRKSLGARERRIRSCLPRGPHLMAMRSPRQRQTTRSAADSVLTCRESCICLGVHRRRSGQRIKTGYVLTPASGRVSAATLAALSGHRRVNPARRLTRRAGYRCQGTVRAVSDYPLQGASHRADRCRVISLSRSRHSRRGRSWRRRGSTSLCLPRIVLVQTTKPDRLPVGHARFLARHRLTSRNRSRRQSDRNSWPVPSSFEMLGVW